MNKGKGCLFYLYVRIEDFIVIIIIERDKSHKRNEKANLARTYYRIKACLCVNSS